MVTSGPGLLVYGFVDVRFDILVYSYFEKGCRKKGHATIPKGIVGSFEFTVLQSNLKEWHDRSWAYVCEC